MHLSVDLILLKFIAYVVVNKTHSTDEQRLNQVRDFFLILIFAVETLCNGRKLLFVFHHEINVKLVNKDAALHTKVFFMKRGRCAVVLEKRVSSLFHNKNVFFRKRVDALVVKVHDANIPCR